MTNGYWSVELWADFRYVLSIHFQYQMIRMNIVVMLYWTIDQCVLAAMQPRFVIGEIRHEVNSAWNRTPATIISINSKSGKTIPTFHEVDTVNQK